MFFNKKKNPTKVLVNLILKIGYCKHCYFADKMEKIMENIFTCSVVNGFYLFLLLRGLSNFSIF